MPWLTTLTRSYKHNIFSSGSATGMPGDCWAPFIARRLPAQIVAMTMINPADLTYEPFAYRIFVGMHDCSQDSCFETCVSKPKIDFPSLKKLFIHRPDRIGEWWDDVEELIERGKALGFEVVPVQETGEEWREWVKVGGVWR